MDFNEQKDRFRSIGLPTCVDFCEHLLHTEHTALLSGSALLLPDDDFSVRCSYVDFDGDKALAAWRATQPRTQEAREAFVRTHFPLIVKGVDSIARYMGAVRDGRKPEHVGALEPQTVGS